MKFIKTICGDIINAEEVLKITFECEERTSNYYSFFILKNGDRYDVYYLDQIFIGRDGICYWFDEECHIALNSIIMKMIMDMKENSIFDIQDIENSNLIWYEFEYWADKNKNKLCVKKKEG